MKQLIKDFSSHLREAIHIGESAVLTTSSATIQNVVISGLGGSGIGGSIVSQLIGDEAKVPIVVNKDYFLPGFVDENTLVIISSYSGNTEETLNALDLALQKGAEIACITSGGKVVGIAEAKELNHIVIPSGFPPRAAFAYSSAQLFFILEHYGIISSSFRTDLHKVPELLDTLENSILQEAEEVASGLFGKMPVIYSDAGFEGVATRLRQQINENSKMLCWHHAIPEMNHNELVGWAGGSDNLAVLILRNDDDPDRNQQRMELNKTIMAKYTLSIFEVYSKGGSKIERAYYLIHLGDWISLMLAEKKGIDPVEVNVIDFLKGELAKQPV